MVAVAAATGQIQTFQLDTNKSSNKPNVKPITVNTLGITN